MIGVAETTECGSTCISPSWNSKKFLQKYMLMTAKDCGAHQIRNFVNTSFEIYTNGGRH